MHFKKNKIKLKPWHIIVISIFLVIQIFPWKNITGIRPANGNKIIVTLGKSGFKPDYLVIKKGETVIFNTTQKEPFWPASNPHPSHTIFPQFDPKQPIAANQSWSFTFNKIGSWGYHDHLNPYFTGTIVVTDVNGNQIAPNYNYKNYCEGVADNVKPQCWDGLFAYAIQNGGLSNAFKVFKYLYDNDPLFIQNGCHWYAHKVGEAAYKEYEKGVKIVLTPETSYCGYGFYHGFMQLLLNNGENLSKAKQFCEYVNQSLGKTSPGSYINCFHGIGHGLIEDPPNPKYWGKPEALIAPPLKICDRVSNDPQKNTECADGVFNALVLFMDVGKYGFNFDTKNPFKLCNEQTSKSHKLACYYEFSQRLDTLSGRNISKMALIAKATNNYQLEDMMIYVGVAAMIQSDIKRTDFSNYIYACRSIENDLEISCIKGITGGLIAHGEPGKEYVKVLNFCNSPVLTNSESNTCFQIALTRLQNIYDPQKMKRVCSLAPISYQKYCSQKI